MLLGCDYNYGLERTVTEAQRLGTVFVCWPEPYTVSVRIFQIASVLIVFCQSANSASLGCKLSAAKQLNVAHIWC